MKALVKYKDWLMLERGEIRLEVGDVLIKPAVRTSEIHPFDKSKNMYIKEEGQFLSKDILNIQARVDLFNRLIDIYKKKGKDFLKDYFIEIEYSSIKKINKDEIKKTRKS